MDNTIQIDELDMEQVQDIPALLLHLFLNRFPMTQKKAAPRTRPVQSWWVRARARPLRGLSVPGVAAMHAARERCMHARLAHALHAHRGRSPCARRSWWSWELVVKDRLRQALSSGWQHVSDRLSTGCSLSRVAACCESRARSCGIDLFCGA